MTQLDLARAVGVTGTSVSEWEADKKSPREDALTRLAEYLGVTPAYLRYGVRENTAPSAPLMPTESFRPVQGPAAKSAKKKRA